MAQSEDSMTLPAENQQTVEAARRDETGWCVRCGHADLCHKDGPCTFIEVWPSAHEKACDCSGMLTWEKWDAALRNLVAQADYEPVVEWCRELLEDHSRCPNIAEFLIWGKLFPPEALGPRCYDCAAKHVGHRNLGGKQAAILDLRRLARLDGAR